jgi:hypothetical protein
MDRQYVDSNLILSIGYNSSSATLEIEFKRSGQIWEYYDVPEYVWFEFQASDSKGKFFLQNIKKQYSENQLA